MDRRQRYLDVALELFAEHGYHGVSTDQVVAAAGGSKATLYRYFDSKEALFEAIIDDIAQPAVDLRRPVDEGLSAASLEDGLRQIGRATAAAALNDRTIVLLRLALGEQSRFPQLASTLFDHGPARTYAVLTAFLAERVAAGELEVDDLQIAAEQFLGGIIGHQQLRLAVGRKRLPAREVEARVDEAVRTFTLRYAVRLP